MIIKQDKVLKPLRYQIFNQIKQLLNLLFTNSSINLTMMESLVILIKTILIIRPQKYFSKNNKFKDMVKNIQLYKTWLIRNYRLKKWKKSGKDTAV